MADDTKDESSQLTLEGAFACIEELKEKIGELEKQNEEYLNGWKRAKADYINFKNEQEKRSSDMASIARITSLLQYLPVLDNFRKAFKHLPDDMKGSDWVKGIEQIYKQLREIMKTMGVEEITDLVGKPFDPSLHQAVGDEYNDQFEEEYITQEVDAGYMHNGTLVAPAKVIVNKKPVS